MVWVVFRVCRFVMLGIMIGVLLIIEVINVWILVLSEFLVVLVLVKFVFRV